MEIGDLLSIIGDLLSIFGIMIILILGIAMVVILLPLNDTIENRHVTNCKEICNSNSLVYYKITNSGYSGLTRICYCKDLDGKISTTLM